MAHVKNHGIGLGHEAGDCGSVNDLAVIAAETGPKGAQMNLELVESKGADTFHEAVEMGFEPAPDFACGNILRGGGGIGAECLFDIRKAGELADGCMGLGGKCGSVLGYSRSRCRVVLGGLAAANLGRSERVCWLAGALSGGQEGIGGGGLVIERGTGLGVDEVKTLVVVVVVVLGAGIAARLGRAGGAHGHGELGLLV